MSKFTKGPWSVADGLKICGIAERDLPGCAFPGPRKGEPVLLAYLVGNCADNDQVRANAALISAAPDIYAALKMAEGYIYGVATNEPEEQDKLMGIIKSALKKAEGTL